MCVCVCVCVCVFVDFSVRIVSNTWDTESESDYDAVPDKDGVGLDITVSSVRPDDGMDFVFERHWIPKMNL